MIYIRLFNAKNVNKMRLNRKYILVASLFGATAVLLGAFGAHTLKEVLSQESLNSFNTGVRYQMYHALLLLIVALIAGEMRAKVARACYFLIVTGILFFSGSIYLLNIGPTMGINMKFLGPITPVGGLLLISAWTLLVIEFARKKTV